ncbi:MAG TPA: (2Fe-2S)-binding protein [Pseudonocardiaceae bacterium]
MASAARRADPGLVVATLRRAARHGPFFELEVVPAGQPRTGAPLADLYRQAGRFDLAELVDHHARRLRTTERRVAASLLFQGIAARLWSPVVGCLRDGLVPDLDPEHLFWWRASPLGLSTDRPTGWITAYLAPRLAETVLAETVLDANLAPLARALRQVTPVAAGLLWGNAASALVGTALVADDEAVRTVVRRLLEREPLRGTTTALAGTGPVRVRRRSCCLFYRVPDGGLCGDCALHSGTR